MWKQKEILRGKGCQAKVSREPKQTGPQLFYFARRYTRDGYHVTCTRVIRYFYLDRAIKQPSPLEKDIP